MSQYEHPVYGTFEPSLPYHKSSRRVGTFPPLVQQPLLGDTYVHAPIVVFHSFEIEIPNSPCRLTGFPCTRARPCGFYDRSDQSWGNDSPGIRAFLEIRFSDASTAELAYRFIAQARKWCAALLANNRHEDNPHPDVPLAQVQDGRPDGVCMASSGLH